MKKQLLIAIIINFLLLAIVGCSTETREPSNTTLPSMTYTKPSPEISAILPTASPMPSNSTPELSSVPEDIAELTPTTANTGVKGDVIGVDFLPEVCDYVTRGMVYDEVLLATQAQPGTVYEYEGAIYVTGGQYVNLTCDYVFQFDSSKVLASVNRIAYPTAGVDFALPINIDMTTDEFGAEPFTMPSNGVAFWTDYETGEVYTIGRFNDDGISRMWQAYYGAAIDSMEQ